jgi:hypothetical protein
VMASASGMEPLMRYTIHTISEPSPLCQLFFG